MGVVSYQQLPGENIQVFALRVSNAIKENAGIDLPDERLFRHVATGLHPSISKKLEYPAPLTPPQLFSRCERIVDTIAADDIFAITLAEQQKPHTPEADHKEDQEIDLTVHQNRKSTCYKCGESGHFACQCDAKRNRKIQAKGKHRKKGG